MKKSNMRNSHKVILLLVLIAGFTISCNNKQENKKEIKLQMKKIKKESKIQKVKTFYINNHLVDCEGALPQKCMQVKGSKDKKWTLFYDKIEKFSYESGFDYIIEVKISKVKNPVQDASSFKYELVKVVSKVKADNCEKKGIIKDQNHKPVFLKKPILYLYPENEINVTVKLENSEEITYSYPKYPKDGWSVEVQKGGKINFNDKDYYSLYWEMKDYGDFKFDEGFIVKKENIISFLEKSLKTLGLNYRESQEFIIYWLPILSKNELTLIKFETSNYNKQQPIEILPKPDTLIRIMMIYKKIDTIDILIKEQVLHKNKREGFVAVEWGGAEIK